MSTELFAGPLMVNPFALIEAFFQIFNGMVFATLLIVTLLKDRLFAPLAINAEPLLLETPPLKLLFTLLVTVPSLMVAVPLSGLRTTPPPEIVKLPLLVSPDAISTGEVTFSVGTDRGAALTTVSLASALATDTVAVGREPEKMKSGV
ncbi:hypothetical protein AAA315_16600 [Ruthenibacterium lactatiformans]|uniref:hypothetical protein n=1 Tax=Ruthenibacterium lactatiformans TaxID=1550024 RepID=UPI0032C08C77